MKTFELKDYKIMLYYDNDQITIDIIYKPNGYIMNHIVDEDDYFTLYELYMNMDSDTVSIVDNIITVTVKCKIGVVDSVKTTKFIF